MKRAVIVSFAVLAAVMHADAWINPRVRTVSSNANDPSAKEEQKRKDELRRNAARKMGGMSVRKVLLPPDAKINGLHVEFTKRIDALCGFELGTVAKGFNPVVNDKGDIVVTRSLGRAFRNCNQVDLTYSKENCALFSIKVFSKPMKMDDAAAKQELSVMADAIRKKFGEKVKSLGEEHRETPRRSVYAGVSSFNELPAYNRDCVVGGRARFKPDTTGQRIVLRREALTYNDKFAMKKEGASPELRWVFSVTLVDNLIRNQPVSAPPPPPSAKSSKADVDAL